ncbi:MAG: DUF1549 and DUF1553 domain-containing protein, partial [Gemmataceae bacterium]|nr:DUF1549 and DUF1553 domain-containing protein [Gemmataceae bacterium]
AADRFAFTGQEGVMRACSLLLAVLAAGAGRAAPPDPQALADRIDAHVDAKLAAAKATPAPPADDAEFLRRASLDLTGRVPSARDVHLFLADPDPHKRAKLIDELLETPRHAGHFAAVWRAALAPEVTAVPEARVFQRGFEAWLRLRVRANARYDAWVRELLTAPLSPDADAPTPALRRPEDPNPLAFYAVKDAKPENLAAATSRVFLGVQIECAQCHDHPFAKWTRDQFWNTAACYAGVDRHGDGVFAPLSEAAGRRAISPGMGKKPVPALFLDDREPEWAAGASPRAALAEWVAAKDNPFFARAAANRVWGQPFGRGPVDPVDDFRDDNPPSHPELLDDLAKAFADAGFDLRFLLRAVCRTKAYQRTSARSDATRDDPRLFARAAVRGLTGEQLFDSLVLATGFREGTGRGSPRDGFLTRFALGGKPAEPETSIPQALALMNGKFVTDATTLDTSPTLLAACETPGLSMADRVEALYVAALGRKPTAAERDRMTKYVADAGADRLGDIFWVLLNSAEFRLNH